MPPSKASEPAAMKGRNVRLCDQVEMVSVVVIVFYLHYKDAIINSNVQIFFGIFLGGVKESLEIIIIFYKYEIK